MRTLIAVFSFCLLLVSSSAKSADRTALVIGNGAYRHAPALATPISDARAVAAALKRLNFEVVEGYDLGIDQMRAAAADFSAKLVGTKAALVYFAGHAGAMDDENFLLPVDASYDTRADVQSHALNANALLREMSKDERPNIIILDACRDNPFGKAFWNPQHRPPPRYPTGLGAMDAGGSSGVLIAFAAEPGSVAIEGRDDKNSQFTSALLKHIQEPGVEIWTVFKRVRQDVWTATDKKQIPWVYSSMIGEFFLNPAPENNAPKK